MEAPAVSGFKFHMSGFGNRVSGFRFRDSDFGVPYQAPISQFRAPRLVLQEKSCNRKLSGNDVDCTITLLLPMKMMLCSKLYCLKFVNLYSLPIKFDGFLTPVSPGVRTPLPGTFPSRVANGAGFEIRLSG